MVIITQDLHLINMRNGDGKQYMCVIHICIFAIYLLCMYSYFLMCWYVSHKHMLIHICTHTYMYYRKLCFYLRRTRFVAYARVIQDYKIDEQALYDQGVCHTSVEGAGYYMYILLLMRKQALYRGGQG